MQCQKCTELLGQAMAAVRAHVEATSRVSDSVISGSGVEGLEAAVDACRDARKAAMKRYQDHLESHRTQGGAAASAGTT